MTDFENDENTPVHSFRDARYHERAVRALFYARYIANLREGKTSDGDSVVTIDDLLDGVLKEFGITGWKKG